MLGNQRGSPPFLGLRALAAFLMGAAAFLATFSTFLAAGLALEGTAFWSFLVPPNRPFMLTFEPLLLPSLAVSPTKVLFSMVDAI